MTNKELLELNKLCTKTDCSLFEPTLDELKAYKLFNSINVFNSKCGCNMLIASEEVFRQLVDNFDKHVELKHIIKDKNGYRINTGKLERSLKWYNQLLSHGYRFIKIFNKYR